MNYHAAGDQARCLREALRAVHGPVALVSWTQPAEFDNVTYMRRVRACRARMRVELERRSGDRPPRKVAHVPHLQGRGALHHHEVYLCGDADQRRRITSWVALAKEYGPAYGLGWVDDPFHMRHPKTPEGRPDRARPKRNMVFLEPAAVGGYLAPYLARGQLAEAVQAGSRVWVSHVLKQRSGWTMERCRWVRQGWHIVNGSWRSRAWWGQPRYPSWWHDAEERAWVLAVVGGGGGLSGRRPPGALPA